MKAITKNLWAPVVMRAKKPWVVWTCVSTTRRDAKTAYLSKIIPEYQKEHLKRVKFMRVFVATHELKYDAKE